MDKDTLYKFFEGHATTDEMQSVREWAEESEENASLLRRERKLFNAMILAGNPERGRMKPEVLRKKKDLNVPG